MEAREGRGSAWASHARGEATVEWGNGRPQRPGWAVDESCMDEPIRRTCREALVLSAAEKRRDRAEHA